MCLMWRSAWKWGIRSPPPEGSWPFSVPRALPGRLNSVTISDNYCTCDLLFYSFTHLSCRHTTSRRRRSLPIRDRRSVRDPPNPVIDNAHQTMHPKVMGKILRWTLDTFLLDKWIASRGVMIPRLERIPESERNHF